jgi:rod shape-determining protein MreC
VLSLSLTALLFIAIDSTTNWLKPVRHYFGEFSYPFYWLADIPGRMVDWSDDVSKSRPELLAEIERLKAENLLYQGQQQRMAEVAAENIRLRSLLNATELLKGNVLVAGLIGVSPDPLDHIIMINRGHKDGVYENQAVIGSEGLMGQVVEVYGGYSQVLLITDANHALPVQVTRNGLRAIAEGTGDFQRLKLRYVSPTMDLRIGDLLVSSGLGGRFPMGYPVGEVVAINRDPGQAFIDVDVKPTEPLSRRRHVLLVFSSKDDLSQEEGDE